MNSQDKTTTDNKKMTQNGSSSKSDSNSKSTSNSKKNYESDDLRKKVSDLAATGASIAIKKAVDASLGSMASNNGSGNQMDNVQWRKLAVWIAVSGVAIGVAKILSSDMVDDLITDFLEED